MFYLDNSATTKIDSNVMKTVNSVSEKYWGNPSSLHKMGILAEKTIKQSKKIIGEPLNISPEDIYFTSGGTESNNMFIKGVLDRSSRRHIITTKIEHPAVYEVVKSYEKKGWRVTWLDVNKEGIISLEDLKNNLKEDTVLTAIMHVNNETGSVQPIKEAAEIVKKNSRSLFFSDGVQGFLKVPIDIGNSKIDAYSISSHKINGPKGVGGLYVKKNIKLEPLIQGGGQERGFRSGTENVPGIAGFAKAVQIYRDDFERLYKDNLRKKMVFIKLLHEKIPGIIINSPKDEKASPYIINCSLPGVRGETILHALEEFNIFISTGSACSSKKKIHNSILREIGLEEDQILGSIRISMGLDYWPKDEEVLYLVHKLQEIWERLK